MVMVEAATDESALIEAELKGWATAFRIALETKQREAAVFAIKEIVSIISAVCYCYDLFDGSSFPKKLRRMIKNDC